MGFFVAYRNKEGCTGINEIITFCKVFFLKITFIFQRVGCCLNSAKSSKRIYHSLRNCGNDCLFPEKLSQRLLLRRRSALARYQGLLILLLCNRFRKKGVTKRRNVARGSFYNPHFKASCTVAVSKNYLLYLLFWSIPADRLIF